VTVLKEHPIYTLTLQQWILENSDSDPDLNPNAAAPIIPQVILSSLEANKDNEYVLLNTVVKGVRVLQKSRTAVNWSHLPWKADDAYAKAFDAILDTLNSYIEREGEKTLFETITPEERINYTSLLPFLLSNNNIELTDYLISCLPIFTNKLSMYKLFLRMHKGQNPNEIKRFGEDLSKEPNIESKVKIAVEYIEYLFNKLDESHKKAEESWSVWSATRSFFGYLFGMSHIQKPTQPTNEQKAPVTKASSFDKLENQLEALIKKIFQNDAELKEEIPTDILDSICNTLKKINKSDEQATVLRVTKAITDLQWQFICQTSKGYKNYNELVQNISIYSGFTAEELGVGKFLEEEKKSHN